MSVKSKTEDLQCFLVVVDCGSFTAAANLMSTQVAKVSRSISRLEKELNVTLFNRNTRRVELTEEGHVFLRFARQSLDTLLRGEELLNNLKGAPRGKLRVDAVSPFLYHQIIPHIADFQAAYPDIQLELISSENIIDLIEKKTDVAIRIGQLADSNLHARCIGRSKLHIVGSPSYFEKFGEPREVADLAQHQIVGFADSVKLNNWQLISHVPIVPTLTVSDGESIRQLVLQGNGIALLSHFMIKQDLEKGALVEVLAGQVKSPNVREPVNAVYYRHSAVSSRIAVFLDFFSQKFDL